MRLQRSQEPPPAEAAVAAAALGASAPQPDHLGRLVDAYC